MHGVLPGDRPLRRHLQAPKRQVETARFCFYSDKWLSMTARTDMWDVWLWLFFLRGSACSEVAKFFKSTAGYRRGRGSASRPRHRVQVDAYRAHYEAVVHEKWHFPMGFLMLLKKAPKSAQDWGHRALFEAKIWLIPLPVFLGARVLFLTSKTRFSQLVTILAVKL